MALHRSPHVKIIQAARRGKGLRLSANEVFEISQEEAIYTAAANDYKAAGFHLTEYLFMVTHLPKPAIPDVRRRPGLVLPGELPTAEELGV